jgi:hypothetical protein
MCAGGERAEEHYSVKMAITRCRRECDLTTVRPWATAGFRTGQRQFSRGMTT